MHDRYSLDELHRQAVALTGDERDSFLNELNDTERQSVLRLLDADAATHDDLTRPPMRDSEQCIQVALHAMRDTPGGVSPAQGTDPPESIGPYQILRMLGKGGMGHVYLAQQQHPIQRQVALKVINTETPTDEILARFEAERQALAMMDHQNIARVLDAGMTTHGRPFFAMELIQGVPLTDFCDLHQLKPAERLELFITTCRAIQHAHQKGIIHRDIKPSNILVSQQDHSAVVKVIDFGLAKAIQNQTQLTSRTLATSPGQVVGTLAYMSPEQAEFNASHVDTRTDVYSLGVVLYELLTGSTPITRDHLRSEAFDRILREIREDEPPRPSTRLSESGDAIATISARRSTEPKSLNLILKGDLDWITMKALDKDPARRYSGVAAFADDIERFLKDEPIEARPPSFGYRLEKIVRKYRAAALSALLTLLALILGLIGTVIMWQRAQTEAVRATEAERTALLATDNVKVQRDRARDAEAAARAAEATAIAEKKQQEQQLARTNYLVSIARWNAGRAGEALRFLDQVPQQHRGIEWFLARREFNGSDLTAYGHRDRVQSVAFRPDQQRVASAGFDATIRIWNATDGSQLQSLTGHNQSILAVAYSPDGKLLASAGTDQTIKIWNAGVGECLNTLTGHAGAVTSLAFSPDGQRLASGSDDDSIIVWRLSDQSKIMSLTGHDDQILAVAFSPDGSTIASSSRDQTIKLWLATSGRELKTLDAHARPVTSIAFNPDGSTLASGSEDNSVVIWDAETGEPLQTLSGHTQGVRCVTYSPDGVHIAAAGDDQSIRLWDARSGVSLETLTGHTDSIHSLSFSASGMRLASSGNDGTVKIWDARTGGNQMTLRGHEGDVLCLALNAAAGLLASGGQDQTVNVWDLPTGQPLHSFLGHRASVRSVAFSSDGKHLISGSNDQTIKLWDLRTGMETAALSGHAGEVTGVAISPDGKWIASASGDHTVRLWDAVSAQEVRSFDGHEAEVLGVRFNSVGSLLASCSADKSIRLWEVATGKWVKTIEDRTPVNAVAFDSNDTHLVSGGEDQAIKLWDVRSGKEIHSLQGHTDPVQQVTFASGDTRILSVSQEGTVKLWDAVSGEELRSLPGRRGRTQDVPLAIAGDVIAFRGTADTIDLWQAPQRAEVRRFRGHPYDVTGVAIAPDGSRIFSEDRRGTQFVWDSATGQTTTQDDWPAAIDATSTRSADGRWLVVPAGKTVQLVDLEFKSTPREQAYRLFKSQPDPIWHRQQAAALEQSRDLFAATLHWSWAVTTDPTSVEARIGQQIVYAQLLADQPGLLDLLPQITKDVLALPRPKFDEDFASAANNTIRRRLLRDPQPLPIAVQQMSQVCERFRQGTYFTTLGIAQFRSAKYTDAIETLTQALAMNQAEQDLAGPHPTDLAFLAMSHFKLDHPEQAMNYVQQLKAAIKQDAYRDDQEVIKIAREAAELFTGSSAL